MKFINVSSDQLHLIYRNSFDETVETSFDMATMTGQLFDTTGEPLQLEGYALEEDGEQFQNIHEAEVIMIDDLTGEQSRYTLQDYVADGHYVDPDQLVGIAA